MVICTARMASAGFIGRIETTSGPWNGPAGTVSTAVRYIGTVQSQVMWRSSMPPSTQRLFERKRAADGEGDEIVAPVFDDVGRLVDQRAVAPDAVARQVGADVEILGQVRDARIAGRADADQRARLRIALAELHEILRQSAAAGSRDWPARKPGARPDVGPEWALRRIASRAARPVDERAGICPAASPPSPCASPLPIPDPPAFAQFSIKPAAKKPSRPPRRSYAQRHSA